MQEKPLRQLPFPIPFILAGQRPHGIRRAFRAAILFDQPGRDRLAHVLADLSRMDAAQAECFEETLPDRRDVDVKFAHAVLDEGRADGLMPWRFVLDDLQPPDPRALLAARA